MLSDLGKTISEWVASETTKDWAKRKIKGHPHVYLVKMPARQGVPAHAGLEINPADQFGNPTKRRGIYIRTADEAETVASVFGAKLPKWMQTLCDALFGDGAVPQDTTEDMLEIED